MGISGSVYGRPAKMSTMIVDADLDMSVYDILIDALGVIDGKDVSKLGNVASGGSTGTSAEQTIPHGLGVIPSLVSLCWTANVAAGSWLRQSTPADNTNIYVTASGFTYNWYAME